MNYFGCIPGSRGSTKRRICISLQAPPPHHSVVVSVSVSLNVKIPTARESQGKRQCHVIQLASWLSRKFSNAKLGRYGLYFCKEKEDPNTYDSLLSPQSLPSTWCHQEFVEWINKTVHIHLIDICLVLFYHCVLQPGGIMQVTFIEVQLSTHWVPSVNKELS